jgi:hypothetical protein
VYAKLRRSYNDGGCGRCVREDRVEADNSIYIGIADVFQDLERRLLFSGILRFARRKKLSSRKREDLLLDEGSHFVTRSFLPGYEEDAGSITSQLYQQLPASNLCPAPNGSDRWLYSVQSSELWVKLTNRRSFACSRGTQR